MIDQPMIDQEVSARCWASIQIGVEHWVGGVLEFAHSGASKTHTRRGGVSGEVVDLGF